MLQFKKKHKYVRLAQSTTLIAPHLKGYETLHPPLLCFINIQMSKYNINAAKMAFYMCALENKASVCFKLTA